MRLATLVSPAVATCSELFWVGDDEMAANRVVISYIETGKTHHLPLSDVYVGTKCINKYEFTFSNLGVPVMHSQKLV